MGTFLAWVCLVGFIGIAMAHMRCQSPAEKNGYRWEAAISLAILIIGTALAVWVTAFTARFTDGPKVVSSNFFWLGGIAAAATAGLMIWAALMETRELQRLGSFIGAFIPVALLSVGLTWVPANIATPVIQGLTGAAAVMLIVLGLVMAQTPDQSYSGWLGAAAGTLVVIARRSGSGDDTSAWQVALGVGLLVSALVLAATTGFGGQRLTGARLWPISRGVLIVAGIVCAGLAFAQLN